MKSLYLLALVPFVAQAGGNPHTPPQHTDPSSNNAIAGASSDADALGLGVGVGIGEGGDASAIAKGGDSHSNSNSTAVGLGGNATGGNAVSGSQSGALSGSLSSANNRNASTNVNGQHVSSDNLNANDNAASASNDGNSLSTSYDNKTTALALGLASVTAAPVDPSVCRRGQTAGWRVTLIERTGRNKYDQDCLAKTLDEQLRQADFARCMDIANAYLKIGVESAYMQQLAKCGGAVEKALISSELASRKPITQVGDPASKEYVNEVVNRAFQSTQRK